MKLNKYLIVAGMLGLAGTGFAQTTTNTAPRIVPERTGTVLQPPTPSGADVSPVANRPERPERPVLSQDIRDRMQRFEKLREAYLAEQRELKRRLDGAVDEDREKIRQLIQERRDAWLDKLRILSEEARERLAELRKDLSQHQEVLDAARESARDRVGEIRDRRGKD